MSIGVDIHAGKRLRLFGQLRSAWETGRDNGPRVFDEDKLNVQNLFAEAKLFQQDDQSLGIRIGRQEVDYGSGRLISVREGPNLRLYFDGVKLLYASRKIFIDGFALMAGTVYPSAFDNVTSKKINLWGAYGKWGMQKAGNLDFYYIGINRKDALFEEGLANELRHTIGARWSKYGGGFIYNLEATYQFGSFGDGCISAWTGSADVGYRCENINGKPSINLRHDYISGDKQQGDGNLQTFNPLYPKGGYFGFNPQVGPVNLIDIHPYTTCMVSKKLTMQADLVFNWRYSLQDGVYSPGGGFNMSGSGSGKRYIGTAWLVSGTHTFNKFMVVNVGAQYFQTGAFINSKVPEHRDGIFMNARLAFKF